MDDTIIISTQALMSLLQRLAYGTQDLPRLGDEVKLDPQPLPPRWLRVFLDPQPLPPRPGSGMLDPQPLPPQWSIIARQAVRTLALLGSMAEALPPDVAEFMREAIARRLDEYVETVASSKLDAGDLLLQAAEFRAGSDMLGDNQLATNLSVTADRLLKAVESTADDYRKHAVLTETS